MRFKDALKRAELREVRFHDLRHTYGTLMAAAGTALRTLQGWMRHRDYKTTEIYAAPSLRRSSTVRRIGFAGPRRSPGVERHAPAGGTDNRTGGRSGEAFAINHGDRQKGRARAARLA